jgi:hypothetical protein
MPERMGQKSLVLLRFVFCPEIHPLCNTGAEPKRRVILARESPTWAALMFRAVSLKDIFAAIWAVP